MSYPKAPQYVVIKDTREQEGYFFNEFNTCKGMVERKLDTGDYSIEGLEDKICIERKGCIEELAVNLGQKKHAFLDEIERMKTFDHKFLILEFALEDLLKFPDESRIPDKNKSSLKITGKYILKCLMEFQIYDGIQVVFCGNKHNAFLLVSSLLKRLNEKYTTGKLK